MQPRPISRITWYAPNRCPSIFGVNWEQAERSLRFRQRKPANPELSDRLLQATKKPNSYSIALWRGERRFEDQPQTNEVIELRRLANVPAGTEPHGVGFVPFGIRRAQNDDRNVTAPLARAHVLQYLASGFLRKIEVENGEVGARGSINIYRLDKRDRGLSIRDHNEFAFNAMFFKRPANQSGIRGIILR
jgi:hypothetical protein